MTFCTDHPAGDIEIVAKGNRVVGTDIDSSGERSCIRQNLMHCSSPEHARIVAAIMDDPILMIYQASGLFTQKKLDEMAETLRQQTVG